MMEDEIDEAKMLVTLRREMMRYKDASVHGFCVTLGEGKPAQFLNGPCNLIPAEAFRIKELYQSWWQGVMDRVAKRLIELDVKLTP